MLLWLWILPVVSAALWLAIGFRLRFLEKMIPALDSTSAVPDSPGGWPFISVIVPARNEEKEVGKCLASLLRQDYPAFELIFVNDQSTDATGRIARETLRDCASCRIIDGAARPAGQRWIGKTWALVQGVAVAKADWLLFIDSDVVHHPSAFRKAMAEAIRLGVDALSILPAIDCRSFWEKTVMPLFASLSVLVEPLDGASQPNKRAARLSGAFLLVKRPIYSAAGGHEAVRDRIIEDMALARILKKQGRRIWLTYTHDLASTRMYDSFRDLWTGLGRLSFPMLNYSLALLLVAHLAALMGPLVPWLWILAGCLLLAIGAATGVALAAVGGLLCVLARWAVQPIFSVVKVPARYAWLLPLASSLYVLAATYAAFRHFSGKGLTWKQREY
jgi:glycosyltransferase involved in cell wall biosynthesis